MSNYKNNRWGFNLSTIGVISFLPVLFLSMWMSLGHAQTSTEIDKQTEAALLAEDWPKVADLLGSVNAETPSPVARLIKGHACLALNRNNESLCLFLSVLSEDSLKVLVNLKQWDSWTKSFVARNLQSAIAHYFRGDALARIKEWDSALETFNKALEFNLLHPMLLNARGVVYAAKDQLGLARLDFEDASKHPSLRLADVYSNIGNLCIQRKDGAEGALKALNEAISISPTFALAVHARGCMNLVSDSLGKATEDFKNAEQNISCATIALLVSQNWIRIAAYSEGMGEADLLTMLSDSSRKAGMYMEAKVGKIDDLWNRYKQNPTQWNYNHWYKNFANLNSIDRQSFLKNKVEPAIKGDNIKNQFSQHWANSYKTNTTWDLIWKNLSRTFDIAGSASGIAAGTTKNPWFLVGIPVGKSASWITQDYGEITKRRGSVASEMKSLLRPLQIKPAGGVDASWVKATWDEGDWPFLSYYGLLYEISSSDHSFTTKQELVK